MHSDCAWSAFIQAARSTSIWVLWHWRPTELVLYLLFCTARTKIRKRVWLISLWYRDHPFTGWTEDDQDEQRVFGAISGQRWGAATLKPLRCLITGSLQEDTPEPYLSHVLLSCSFCDSKESLVRPKKFLLFRYTNTRWQPSYFCYNTTSHKLVASDLLLYF